MLKIQFVRNVFDTKNKGELSSTGRLGETMKESVEIVKIAVFNYALTELQMAPEALESYSYHLHVPHGAIPKDGPSAGTSIFAALMSLLINKPVRQNLALTGEISTLGEVITIGGVREKLTACKNHGISQVVLPFSNRQDFEKLPAEFKSGFSVFFVKSVSEVFRVCFGEEGDTLEDIERVDCEEAVPEGRALEVNDDVPLPKNKIEELFA